MKKIIILMVFLAGCVGQYEAEVDRAITPECESFNDISRQVRCQIRADPSPYYCGLLDDERDCIVELAGITRDERVCDGLEGSTRIICEAVAKDEHMICEGIPDGQRQYECLEWVGKFKEQDGSIDCLSLTGDEMIWCLIHNAKDEGQCLHIDDRRHADEHIMCKAKAGGNIALCESVGDSIMRELCRKEVMDL
jgi:hypothetical protein